MNIFLLLGLVIATGFILQTTVLWLAAHICGMDGVRWWRAAAAVGIKFALELTVVVILMAAELMGEWTAWVGLFALDTILTFWLIGKVFGGSKQKRAATWALNAAAGIAVGIAFVVVVTMLLEAFIWPNSSMSPNIRGYHVVEVLPDGNHLIHAANQPGDNYPAPGDRSGAIVAETFEYRVTTRPATYTHTADRFICNKTKFPERWDATVFKYPREPSLLYVKRLVGLPGETIAIHGGTVWVNGERLTPPERLGQIRYEAGFDSRGEERGVFEVTLGPEEYFVLGDNTNKSADSRHWGPVERELIIGVADLIYWPPARWRIRP
jgi:signal peptidase I